jgi:hypothetical protein
MELMLHAALKAHIRKIYNIIHNASHVEVEDRAIIIRKCNG